jgi:hypothetical protein
VPTEIRFLLDEDLNPAVAEIGRNLGLDVVSVHEIDRRGFPDEEQLRFAISEKVEPRWHPRRRALRQ